ncbi:MAG: virulence factor [Hyphomicrobiales bacterium]
MADLIVVYWRDIPAQVIVKAGRKTERRQLEKRFEIAIDAAAMRDGMTGTDAYLEQWRRADPVPVEGDMAEAADAAVERLETEFDKEKLRALVHNGGNA